MSKHIENFSIVIIKSDKDALHHLNGKQGFIDQLGFYEGEYEVMVDDQTYEMEETDFILTGERMPYPYPKFSRFEYVKIVTEDPEYLPRNGYEGGILNITQYSNGEIWYSLNIPDIEKPAAVLFIPEEHLVSTGKFGKYEDFYHGSWLSVSQEGELLDGEIKDDEQH